MKFLRQLAAASLAVAVIVALGAAWAHAGSGALAGGHRPPGPPPAAAAAPQRFRAADGTKSGTAGGTAGTAPVAAGSRLAGGPDPRNLVRTAVAETLLGGIVVSASAVRRRRARRRRRTLRTAGQT